jgi:hypothetical protein
MLWSDINRSGNLNIFLFDSVYTCECGGFMFKNQSSDLTTDESATRRLILKAGLLYGLFYAIGFSMMTWGYDGWILRSYGDVAPWDKLLIGFPVLILIGLLAGWLGLSTSTSLIPVLVWGAAGCGIGLLVGHIPFEGVNLMTWLREPRLWGEIIFSFQQGAQVRTILITIVTTLLGFFIGSLKNTAVHWAWDQGTQNHRLSWKSIVVLWVSLPFSILQAGVADLFMNQPLREPQKAEEELMTDTQKVGFRSLQPYQQTITPDYKSHLVGFSKSTESWYSGYLDLWVNSELTLRCVTVGDRVVYCDDYTKRLNGWVGELAHAGLTKEQRWLQNPMKPISVDEAVMSWLGSIQSHLSEEFDIQIDNIIRGWYFINVHFSTGFEMQCRFHGVEPVVVDDCVIVSSTMPEK